MATISLTENVNRNVKYWPRFNPWAIELAMNSRGATVRQLSESTGIKHVETLIKGELEATHVDIEKIGSCLDYPVSFFEEYFKTKIVWDGEPLAYHVPIRYCDYPIFMTKKR